MSTLIAELKKEHSEIATALSEVNEIGISTNEGQEKLMSLKEQILLHLKKEDEQLFPLLRKEAEHNMELKKSLDLYATNLNNVTVDAQKFFDKYYKKDPNIMFVGEFVALFTTLNERMKKEEEILFREYEKINQ
ncbi:MAG: hemerythrin domain-containing protein [Candidatus Scalindua sp.]|nr:hemerythrin domain-containing protein [Candidatus Scalindua sp.]